MVAPATLSLGSFAGVSGLASTYSTNRKVYLPRKPSFLSPECVGRRCCSGSQLLLGSQASRPLTLVPRAVTLDQDSSSQPTEEVQEKKPAKYHFVVANAKFMLDEEEHFREQLFERQRLFRERGMEQDFWLVVEPKFLSKFPDITRRLKRPAVALVSTDAVWIKFMKLRLDRVLLESFEASSMQEALEFEPVELNFEKPATWTAPYPKYESGWWENFLPPK